MIFYREVQIVHYVLHNTLVLSSSIDVVLTLSVSIELIIHPTEIDFAIYATVKLIYGTTRKFS